VALVRTDVSEEPNLRYRGTSPHQGDKNELARNNVSSNSTVNVVPSSLILFALIMEMIRSSETPVLSRVIRRHIPEDDVHHSHRRDNLISCVCLCSFINNNHDSVISAR
jgi:hypothetical protein